MKKIIPATVIEVSTMRTRPAKSESIDLTSLQIAYERQLSRATERMLTATAKLGKAVDRIARARDKRKAQKSFEKAQAEFDQAAEEYMRLTGESEALISQIG